MADVLTTPQRPCSFHERKIRSIIEFGINQLHQKGFQSNLIRAHLKRSLCTCQPAPTSQQNSVTSQTVQKSETELSSTSHGHEKEKENTDDTLLQASAQVSKASTSTDQNEGETNNDDKDFFQRIPHRNSVRVSKKSVSSDRFDEVISRLDAAIIRNSLASFAEDLAQLKTQFQQFHSRTHPLSDAFKSSSTAPSKKSQGDSPGRRPKRYRHVVLRRPRVRPSGPRSAAIEPDAITNILNPIEVDQEIYSRRTKASNKEHLKRHYVKRKERKKKFVQAVALHWQAKRLNFMRRPPPPPNHRSKSKQKQKAKARRELFVQKQNHQLLDPNDILDAYEIASQL